MHVIRARNINDATREVASLLSNVGREINDHVSTLGPVSTVLHRPLERVNFNTKMDLDPFEVFFQGLWCLSGRNDVAYMAQFNPRWRSRSTDGDVIWNGLGARWRSFFDRDQLEWILRMLSSDPDYTHAMVQCWDPCNDPLAPGENPPRDVVAKFQRGVDDQLDMIVFSARADLADPSSAWSFLHEFVASALGTGAGFAWHVAGQIRFHSNMLDLTRAIANSLDHEPCPYHTGGAITTPLVRQDSDSSVWEGDLAMFMEEPTAVGFRNKFFRKIAKPMFLAAKAYRESEGKDKFDTAFEILGQMEERSDWRMAAERWISRRFQTWEEKRTINGCTK